MSIRGRLLTLAVGGVLPLPVWREGGCDKRSIEEAGDGKTGVGR